LLIIRGGAHTFFKGIVHTHALTPIKTGCKNDANPMAWIMGDLLVKNYKLQNTNYKQITNYNVQNYKPNGIHAFTPQCTY
jgi:hypothetical protein